MNWTDFVTETNAEMAALRKAIPDPAAAFAQLAKTSTAKGALDPKVKELMALAIGITERCDGCIAYHVKAALRHGATREEVAETIAMCVYMGGGPSMIFGAKALAAFDSLAGEKS